jgi:hypothetical protein
MLGLTNQPHLCLSHLRLHTWHVAWGWHKGRELTEGQHQQSHGQNALGHHPGDGKSWKIMEKCWETMVFHCDPGDPMVKTMVEP